MWLLTLLEEPVPQKQTTESVASKASNIVSTLDKVKQWYQGIGNGVLLPYWEKLLEEGFNDLNKWAYFPEMDLNRVTRFSLLTAEDLIELGLQNTIKIIMDRI